MNHQLVRNCRFSREVHFMFKKKTKLKSYNCTVECPQDKEKNNNKNKTKVHVYPVTKTKNTPFSRLRHDAY